MTKPKIAYIMLSELNLWWVWSAEFHAWVDRDIKDKVLSMSPTEIDSIILHVFNLKYKYFFQRFFSKASNWNTSNKKVALAMLLQCIKDSWKTFDEFINIIDQYHEAKEKLHKLYS